MINDICFDITPVGYFYYELPVVPVENNPIYVADELFNLISKHEDYYWYDVAYVMRI